MELTVPLPSGNALSVALSGMAPTSVAINTVVSLCLRVFYVEVSQERNHQNNRGLRLFFLRKGLGLLEQVCGPLSCCLLLLVHPHLLLLFFLLLLPFLLLVLSLRI